MNNIAIFLYNFSTVKTLNSLKFSIVVPFRFILLRQILIINLSCIAFLAVPPQTNWELNQVLEFVYSMTASNEIHCL